MAITIAHSTVICCCIGILVVPLYNVSSTMSNMIGLKGFAAGVLGGFGYMPGCIAGGLVLRHRREYRLHDPAVGL